MSVSIDVLVSFFIGVASGFAANELHRRWVRHRSKQQQVRSIGVEVSFDWDPIEPNRQVLQAARLLIRNASEWTVPEILVLDPEWLNAHVERQVPSGAEKPIFINLESMGDQLSTDDIPITLQVVDINHRTWEWTPRTRVLKRLPARLRPHAAFAQWSVQNGPALLGRRFQKLPLGIQTFLWGYDPRGLRGEGPQQGNHDGGPDAAD